MTDNNFSSLQLSTEFIANLTLLAYQTMTPIQAQSLPAIIKGEDILAQAKTGSGKTAAFGIALLHKLNSKNYRTQSLVLCPTRELADQVSKELRRLARPVANTKILSLCGGTPIAPQFASLDHPAHIVVGTPGRILKHIEKGSLKLDTLQTLVLDEADRMLDMGFYDDIMKIVEATPKQRQTLLFSATYPKQIKNISKTIQRQPLDIRVESFHDDGQIKQVFFEIQKDQRTQILMDLLQHYHPQSSVIFCNRKQQCQDVADELCRQGFQALALHGDLEQKDRDRVLVQFSNKSCAILVATDVAARGLDIKDLDAVINFELSPDPEVHIHRIGRTGRAGNEGLALSLFAASEAAKVNAIEEYQKIKINIEDVVLLQKGEHIKPRASMITLCIYAGRKDKVRPGDILGALTANKQVLSKQIGKIDIFDRIAYVAVDKTICNIALKILSNGKIKARKFRVKKI